MIDIDYAALHGLHFLQTSSIWTHPNFQLQDTLMMRCLPCGFVHFHGGRVIWGRFSGDLLRDVTNQQKSVTLWWTNIAMENHHV